MLLEITITSADNLFRKLTHLVIWNELLCLSSIFLEPCLIIKISYTLQTLVEKYNIFKYVKITFLMSKPK